MICVIVTAIGGGCKYNGPIKNDDMTYTGRGEEINTHRTSVETSEGKGLVGSLSRRWNIILKWNLWR